MTPERWQRIDDLLQQAVRRPRHERAAFLDEVCADEVARQEVESLISFHEQADNFLEVPAFEAAAGFLADQPESLVGLAVGPYKIGRLLGAGGMGEVYLAEDTKLDRKVAIKFLPAYLEADELSKRRLIREAKSAAKLDHPNICATYEVAEEAGRSFIVMQYVQGESLAGRLGREPMELRESLDAAVQVADALVEAHSHGIIHRDIKPQNIMITPRGQVKVLDFGLAKVVRSIGLTQNEGPMQSVLSAPGLIVGTAPYMSPEQAKGTAPVDARSDLFSIGVVLYECIAGRPPFSGGSAMEICSQVIHVDPPPPSQFNPHVPPELDALTVKLLAKHPDARYQSAGQLHEDLRVVLASLAVEDHSLTKPITKLRTSSMRVLTTLSNIARPGILIPATLATVLALIALLVLPTLLRAKPHRMSVGALPYYDEGMRALRSGAPYTASKALQRAISIDNESALMHARLAEAWAEMDYPQRASDEFIRAAQLVPNRSALPPLEALYLKAIENIVVRNLTSAIEGYSEIARQAPVSEKAHAFVDLGRAYEKNDEIKKAIGSYREAVDHDPQDAPAFLRLGILYGRMQDRKNAEEAFQRAETIYQPLSNVEGITEVLYQRGVFLNKLGKRKEAMEQLEQALTRARLIDNHHQRIRTLLQLSKVYYVPGKTTRALEYATEAIAEAKASGIENLSTQGLIDLGTVFMYGGDYDEAERYLNQALEFARLNNGSRNEAMAELSLGNLRVLRHDANGGLPYIERALEFYKQGGYREEISEGRILLARANSLKGEYDAALKEYDQVLEVAQAIDDQPLLARVHADEGNLLIQLERYPEALGHVEESARIYTSLGDNLRAGYSWADCCDALWRLGRDDDARKALGQASYFATQTENNKPLVNKISLIDAYLTLSERQFPDARQKAEFALGKNAGEEPEVEAKYLLGLAQAFSGDKRQGKLICEQAVEMARNMDNAMMLSNALLALAEVMLEGGSAQAALRNAREAQEKFEPTGRQESEWRALLVAGRASQRLGDFPAAGGYLSRARGLLASLRDRWGADAYKQYLDRNDIQHSMQHLRELEIDINK